MPSIDEHLASDCYTPLIIPLGQASSPTIDLLGTDLCGIFFPTGMVESSVRILASDSFDGTYFEVMKDESANQAYTITAAAGKYVPITNLAVVAGLRFIRLVANTNVAANRALIIASRRI